MNNRGEPGRLWGLNRYEWLVLTAAWLGWGFDAFDALLFNYVAPTCIPDLLGLEPGSAEARARTLYWTGSLTALLLLGWAVGGIFFGWLADRIGRSRTLVYTILLYSLGTAACALVPNLGWLALCRFVSSLGIGGEWAAGAAMVAEVMPERRRLQAGALLYTAAPLGVFMAGEVTWLFTSVLFTEYPEAAWRGVFLTGLIPGAVALGLRLFLKEPESWQARSGEEPPRLGRLFAPDLLRRTLSGLLLALGALLTWWSCNAFLPLVAQVLGGQSADQAGLIGALKEQAVALWRSRATGLFNLGGLVGTLLTVPLALHLGRRVTLGLYLLVSGLAILTAFGTELPSQTVLGLFFLMGCTSYGALGSFTYYLPELFPTALRATGSGFCYNAGRVLTAPGPFLVAALAAEASHRPEAILSTMAWVGWLPLLTLLLLPWAIETRGLPLDTGRGDESG